MARYALALFWLGLLAGVGPAAAQSRINRCIHHDGHAVYTDQACTDLRLATWPRTGSTLRPPFAPPPHGCARDRNDLQRRLQRALDASNLNALAAAYHWPGTRRPQAERVMGRLDRLLDGDAVAAVSMDAVEIAAARFDEESGSAAERARFGLARHAGCWWIVD